MKGIKVGGGGRWKAIGLTTKQRCLKNYITILNTRAKKKKEKRWTNNLISIISDVVCDYLSLNWHYSSRREKREGKFRAGGKILGWKKYVTIAKDIRSRESISLIPLRQR